ncbi:MAG: hypothetical protein ACI93N_001236 [Flavobacteriaceae bacterium]|jgi:hypothetical protein
MKSIGGYFELELGKSKTYHNNALCLNTGRNALEYILLASNYKKVYLPIFSCEVLLEPIEKHNLDIEFYTIDEFLEPIFDFDIIKQNEGFLYINYFGLKDEFVNVLANRCTNLIIDNSQGFYSCPLPNIDTFYSPRKYFGVSDGAYLYPTKRLDVTLEIDFSFDRFEHLLRRIDVSPENGFPIFVKNDLKLRNQSIKKMSKLTQFILASIDYDKCASLRNRNFEFLHNNLQKRNKLNFDKLKSNASMIYPFWTENKDLKKTLLENKIYTPTYWPSVKENCKKDSLENKLVNEVVYLPIDQRQTQKELTKIINIIKNEY